MKKHGLTILLTAGILGVSALGMLLLFWALDNYGDADGMICIFGAVLAFIISNTLLFSALYMHLYGKQQERGCTVTVRAVVSHIRERQMHIGDSRHPTTMYLPDLSYTLNGEARIAHSSMGTYNQKLYTLGQELDILVNPDDDTRCCFPGETARRIRPLVIIGSSLWAVTLMLFIAGMRM